MTVLEIGILIIVLLLIQGASLWYLFGRKRGDTDPRAGNDQSMLLLQQQLQNLERTLDARVAESSKQMQESSHRQFSESSKLVKEITEELTSVKEISRQTQSFAEELKDLQDILKNPKQRGILGEYYLETTLKNVLPPDGFQMQYPFKNGEIVDAAVFVNGKVVPIDSKFSLDNYNRLIKCEPSERAALEKAFVNDLKVRITETAKYIRPEENTLDFAFMFIPSEGIYYDLLTNQVGAAEDESLLQRAAAKHKVIIVSPTSFLAYLQTVLVGLNALKIEKQTEEIQKRVGELGKHIGSYEEYYRKLGVSLGTAVSHYNSGYKELNKVDKDVYRIAGEKVGIETNLLDKPAMEIE
jgi:DNA recombination protein RmuC